MTCSIPSGRRRREERAEQPVRLVVRSGGKEQRRLGSRVGIVTEGQSPQAVDLQWPPIRAVQHAAALVLAVAQRIRRVVSVNAAVAEVADQQVVAELAETSRRYRQSPWGVERPARGDPADQDAVGVERV